MHIVLGLLLSAAVGVSLGLIGGGGSVITVPLLVYVLGVEPRQAIGMSLAVVGITSLIGVVLHARRGAVEPKTGVLFSATGIPGAYGGSRLTHLVSPAALLLTFAVLMLVVAALMLIGRQSGGAGKGNRQRPSPTKAALAGLTVGVLTGFLGVGGGFLTVPALCRFGGLAMRGAIGTSLLVIAMNCSAGLVGHLHYGSFHLWTTMLITGFAVTGTLLGTAVSHRVSPARLRVGFAVFVMAVAAWLIAKHYTVLF